jgi:hypothetical protein
MKRTVLLGLLGLLVADVALAARSATPLGFSTVVRDSKPVGSDEPSWDLTKVGEVRGWIVPDATQMTYLYYAFPTADEKKFDAVSWSSHFVFAAITKQRTSGYRVTIRRISLQRISRKARQLCVIASIEKPRPGEGVVTRPHFATHVVAMASARFRVDQFHWAIPTRFVVRSPAGALLAVSRTGGSRGNSFVSSKPKLCRPGVRASLDDAT